MTADIYDKIVSEVGIASSLPPGCRAHIAGPSPDGSAWRVISVWDDLSTAQEFVSTKVRPAQERAGVPAPTGPPQTWSVHNLVL